MPTSHSFLNSSSGITVAHALQQGIAQGLAPLDAQLLLLHALGRDDAGRAWLLAHDGDLLPSAAWQLWQQLVQRRLQGEPIAYLRGWREFFGLRLAVDSRVLDPRPDTETLVEWALNLLPALGEHPTVADLGTGSGAIACALAQHAPHARVWASDASAAALQVAQHNAQRLQLPVQFVQGPWLQAFAPKRASLRFDLLLSNPPYIRANDPHLPALRHEPLQALVSGDDGLDDIRTLIEQAPQWLRTGGWLLLEHGYDQADAVQQLLQERGFVQVQSRQDLAGIMRCSGGQWL
ncbi:MAG: peptide chain release factor N(5)-glutamine methyltransferase [Brachymonas sp.]|nr:peptide chain release factor N(5)-glutamine methyltransferase [Brachymonas sp.]